MQLNITIADVMTANIRGTMVERDLTVLPPEALAYIFQYGFQRINNDSAGANKDEAAVANSDKKWAALVSGKIRASGTRTTDELGKECKRLAEIAVKAAIKAKNATVDKDQLKALIAKHAASATIVAKAKVNLEATADMELDIEI